MASIRNSIFQQKASSSLIGIILFCTIMSLSTWSKTMVGTSKKVYGGNRPMSLFVQAWTSSSTSRGTRPTKSMISSLQRSFVTTTTSTSSAIIPNNPLTSSSSACTTHPKALHSERSFFHLAATTNIVDEDLDAVLDNILGSNSQNNNRNGATRTMSTKTSISQNIWSTQQEQEEEEQDTGSHIPGSKPMPNVLLETDPVNWKDPKILSTNNTRWTEAGMDPRIIDVLSQKGISSLTPVQAEAFEPILARRDVIGRSRTGTGKTLAFAMPGLLRIQQFLSDRRDPRTGRNPRGRQPAMLVICPTRELARQVSEEITLVAKPLGLFVDVFHGGVSYGPQAGNLREGIDVLVGTPGRLIDHIERGNLNLSRCDLVVLDEADEMLNMGFAEDVERMLEGVGQDNPQKTQCLLFSATTPPWVKTIGRRYQNDPLSIDSTGEEGGARVANTVRHTAIQVPPGADSKLALLEDIIAVEISRDQTEEMSPEEIQKEEDEELANPVAKAARDKRKKANLSQKVFGKTIVFVETKKMADELVSGGVFKSLTAQALHGDVGQKQRDSTLTAFRKGAFNVLVATDVAARGIDIKDVDLVIQFDPPRDTDSYVHRSGRTGRAGEKGVSVLLFNSNQARDIVRIERELGHDFKFQLLGPPSVETAMVAASKTSAMAIRGIPDETANYFRESAEALLNDAENPVDVVARCLAAISRKADAVQARSLLTGEPGMATVEMKNGRGRSLSASDVMYTVNKLARMSRDGDEETKFDGDVGRIEADFSDSAVFDMSIEDAKKLVVFSKNVEAGGSTFTLLKELEVDRDDITRRNDRRRRSGRESGPPRTGGWADRNGSRGGYFDRSGGGRNAGSYKRSSYTPDHAHTGRSNRYGDGGGSERYDRGDRHSRDESRSSYSDRSGSIYGADRTRSTWGPRPQKPRGRYTQR